MKKESEWYVIDRSGKVLLETEYDIISTFREGMAIVQKAEQEYGEDVRYNLIDGSGNLVFKREYDEIGSIGEGLIFVLIGQNRPEMERIPLLKQTFEELKIEKAFEKHGRKMEPDEIRYQIGHEYYKKLLLDKSI